MYSSVRKELTSRPDTKLLEIESKKYRTVSKNTRTYSRSEEPLDDNNDREIRKQMTSNAYNSVFNRLVKIKDLKEFVRQSSQYVEFHQEEIQNYIVTGHNDKKRFSFSLKNSICSFLSRDYRFLKHYFTLLEKEFPEKADHFRHEIYYSYKDLVIDKKKFESLFAPNSISKSLAKSQQKIKKLAKSLNKTNKKSEKKIEPISILEEGETMVEKSIKKSRKTVNKKMDDENEKSHKKITHTNENFIKVDKNTLSKSKHHYKTKNYKKIQEENIDPNAINSPEFNSKRRTTMENIKLIEETLNEIETIFSNENSQTSSSVIIKENNVPFSKNKSINKYETPRFNKKSKIKKEECELEDEQKLSKVDETLSEVEIEKKERQLNQMINREDETLEKLFAMRSNNKSKKKNERDEDDFSNEEIKSKKSKIKSSAKKDRKTVTFDEVFDINDPENKTLIETVESIRKEREIKKEAEIQKDKKANEILEKVRLSMSLSKTKKILRPYDNKEKELLCSEEKEIVDLFEDIDAIGNYRYFIIDRNCNICGVLGEVNGFKIEYVLAWPETGEEEDVFKALYLTKLQENPSNERLNKLSIKELKNKISETATGILTLLLIEK